MKLFAVNETPKKQSFRHEKIAIRNENGILIARVWQNIGHQTPEQTQRNALLLSKAPELLEELKHCVEALEVFDTAGTRLITNRVHQLLKDATTLPNE